LFLIAYTVYNVYNRGNNLLAQKVVTNSKALACGPMAAM
jgi:hypothetical protein